MPKPASLPQPIHCQKERKKIEVFVLAMWEPIVAEHGWDWEVVVCTGKLSYCCSRSCPKKKKKEEKNESTVTLKSLQPAEQNKALMKDKKIGNASRLPTCSGNLNNKGYLILSSLGLGSLH